MAGSTAKSTGSSQKERTPTGKPSAPVDISGSIGEGVASLQLLFHGAAENVEVRVWGTDGLEVKGSATPIAGGRYASGDRVPVEVTFSAPSSASDLAVSVSGTFNGNVRSRVQSFSVHGDKRSQKAGTGESRTDAEGRPIKVMRPE